MIGISINDWLIDNTLQLAANTMGISRQAVYKMIENGRDVRIIEVDGKIKFIEIKELS